MRAGGKLHRLYEFDIFRYSGFVNSWFSLRLQSRLVGFFVRVLVDGEAGIVVFACGFVVGGGIVVWDWIRLWVLGF